MLKTTLEVAGHCLYQSLRHPRTAITQVSNPVPIEVSPIPWWGSAAILVIGIASWCIAYFWKIDGLDEASRAMVYCPLMHLFDMSWYMAKKVGR